jgi:itaconate CoA-transferase
MTVGSSLAGPLDGIRVISVEQAVAAPLCTRHMAEMGAEVIKIERVGSGDFARAYDTAVLGHSAHFVWLNHGKKSLELDFTRDAGRELLCDLLRESDVLVSNLAPGSIERVVSPDQLERLNPKLVHCLIDGYGRGGPYDTRKAYDLLVQGEAGVTANTGLPGQPAKPAVSLADLGAGTYALAAILAALRERDITGRGRRVAVSLFDVVTEWMMPLLLTERYGGSAPPPAGTHHASIVPYGAFDTADGRTINIAVQNERQWELLCREVLQAPELLEDPRFQSNEHRLEHRPEVIATIGTALGELPFDELAGRLDQAGIPWGRMNDLADVVDHPQLAARERWRPVDLQGPDGTASMESLASPLSDLSPPGEQPAVPALGAHTRELLLTLGLSSDRIHELSDSGVVGALPSTPGATT